MREDFFHRSFLPISGSEAAEYLKNRLGLAYDQFLETLPSNTYAKVDDNRWHLSVDLASPLAPTEEIKLQKQRIYRIDTHKDYEVIQPLVSRRDRNLKMDLIVEQWNRMGQFYATLKSGHTTASVALKRLYSMSRKNRFYLANLAG